MLAQKIIIYGDKDGGKYSTALKLIQDNVFLGMLADPVIIKDVKSMREFLSSVTVTIGIINAKSPADVIKKCKGLNMGAVIFMADPTIIEQCADDIVKQEVWNGSSAAETWDKAYASVQ